MSAVERLLLAWATSEKAVLRGHPVSLYWSLWTARFRTWHMRETHLGTATHALLLLLLLVLRTRHAVILQLLAPLVLEESFQM